MKKCVKNNKKIEVLRWVLLVPSVIATWYIVMFFVAQIWHLFDLWGWAQPLGYFGIVLFGFCGFLLPSIAMYFVARYGAPKYKNIVGWSAVVFCALWEIFLILGLSHLAY